MTHVFLLAFDRPKEGYPNLPLRAMIPTQNRAVLQHVLTTVTAIPEARITVLTSKADAIAPLVAEFPGVRVAENPRLSAPFIQAQLQGISPCETVLVINAALAFLTRDELLELAAQVTKDPALVLPIVAKTALPVYLNKKSASFTEGSFTPGYGLAFSPDLANSGTLLQTVENYVSSPLQIMQELGPAFVIRLMLGQLSLQDVQQKLSERLGIPVRFAPFNSAGFANSVARPADLGV
jgi:hypothetical protein